MLVIAAGGIPVAVNVTGLPWTVPEAVAVSVLRPAARIQLPTVAMPEASVIWVAPVTLPPPVTAANVTVIPEAGLPSPPRTTTDGLGDTGAPVAPVRFVGEFAEIVPAVSPERNATMSSIMVAGNAIPPMAVPAGELLNAGEV